MIASLAAYAFAWIDFKGRNAIFIVVFALQIVPIQMALVPLLQLFSAAARSAASTSSTSLGMHRPSSSYAQVWIAHTIFALPLAIFLLHNFISEIPGEVIEAARVDGAGHGQIFFRIVLPLSMPAIASFAIFQFLWVWNDLLVALDLRRRRGGADHEGAGRDSPGIVRPGRGSCSRPARSSRSSCR